MTYRRTQNQGEPLILVYNGRMDRKVPFREDEIYHLYTRGVEKRIVFNTDEECNRFMLLLYLCNDTESQHLSVLLKRYQGESLIQIFEKEKRVQTLVDIIAYTLMLNHIHLIVREKIAGGISKFMLKLMTAYSMFFNTKYERSGPLFTRPFRSKHVDSDEYFQWLFAYVLLNPLELFDSKWKKSGVLEHEKEAGKFMRNYKYSSFPDYFVGKRIESRIIDKSALPMEAKELENMDDLLTCLANGKGEYQGESLM